jgi:hypothetical protein
VVAMMNPDKNSTEESVQKMHSQRPVKAGLRWADIKAFLFFSAFIYLCFVLDGYTGI